MSYLNRENNYLPTHSIDTPVNPSTQVYIAPVSTPVDSNEWKNLGYTTDKVMFEVKPDKRVECLDKAKECVTQDRTTVYGTPEDNFKNIAAMWNAQGFCHGGVNGSRPITPTDVALMMIAMKLARLRNSPSHEDSWVDAAGYAACGMRTADVETQLIGSVNEKYEQIKKRNDDITKMWNS